MFLVTLAGSGPEWDPSAPLEEQSGWAEHAEFMDGLVAEGVIVLGGPLDEVRVAPAIEADSPDAVRAALARDPWTDSHLVLERIERWTIRLDGTLR